MTADARRRLHEALLRRRRLARRLYADVVEAVRHLVPVAFPYAGEFRAFTCINTPEAIRAALRDTATFALDSAADLRGAFGPGARADVWAYVETWDAAVEPLVRSGALRPRAARDPLLPLHDPPPRLLAVLPRARPESEALPSGYRVVTPERLLREILGVYGQRWDLLAATLAGLAGRYPIISA